ncbi:hypothetical protein Tco_0200893 [Tanacetum coccineum]
MKTSGGFWDAVITYFEKETGSTRGYDSIVSKWKNRVRPRIDAFCTIIHNVEANHESGTNDLDVYHKTCAEYKMIYKQDFTGRKTKSKTSKTTSGSSGGINLNDEADEAVEETQEGKKDEQQQSYIDFKNRELSIQEAEAREITQLKREKLKIQRRTLELAEREKRDRDILFYNSVIDPYLPAIQQQKLLEMKMEIKARYNLDY